MAGHQWSDEDKEVLREQMRPEITFNRIAPTVESVIGLSLAMRCDLSRWKEPNTHIVINRVFTSYPDLRYIDIVCKPIFR